MKKQFDIPFFNYPALYHRNEQEFNNIFKDVCSRGAYILQSDLEEFEKKLAEFIGCKYAIGVADGTNAILLGLNAMNICAEDDVIISSHTYIATAAAVKMAGANIVFADIDSNNLLCAKSAEKQITPKTKLIMPTQLNGRCSDMDAILDLAHTYGIKIAEDSAQGLGARYKNRSAGTFGSFGTISFYPAKLIGCFGDGGAVITDDDSIAEKVYYLRDHGRNISGDVVTWGTNCRLDNLQAAFLKFRLSQYSEDIIRRREIAQLYHDGLINLSEIKLPPPPNSSSNHFDVYQNYEIEAYERDKLRSYLLDMGIKTIIQWSGMGVHHFNELGFGKEKYTHLGKTDKFFENCMMLPMNMSINNEEINYIIESINNFYK